MSNESERAAFEKWARKKGYEFVDSDKGGHYFWERTAEAWIVWQERAQIIAEQAKAKYVQCICGANCQDNGEGVCRYAEQEKAVAVAYRFWNGSSYQYSKRPSMFGVSQPLYLHPASSTNLFSHPVETKPVVSNNSPETRDNGRVAAQVGDELVEAVTEAHKALGNMIAKSNHADNEEISALCKLANALQALRATPADGDGHG